MKDRGIYPVETIRIRGFLTGKPNG